MINKLKFGRKGVLCLEAAAVAATNRCVSGSTVVGGDASFGWKGALSAVWGATRYYLFIMTKRSGQGSIHGNYAVITVILSW